LLEMCGFEDMSPKNHLHNFFVNAANERLLKEFQDTFKDILTASCLNKPEESKKGYSFKPKESEAKGSEYATGLKGVSVLSILNTCPHSFGAQKFVDGLNTQAKDIKPTPPYRSSTTGHFVFKHFSNALEIEYDATDFIPKNSLVPGSLKKVGMDSTNQFVKDLFSRIPEDNSDKPTGKDRPADGDKPATRFIKELDAMMGSVVKTERHWIRCISPKEQATETFNNKYVLKQLEALDVMESTRIQTDYRVACGNFLGARWQERWLKRRPKLIRIQQMCHEFVKLKGASK